MDRLQKKCVAVSVGLHSLLAAVLVFGPAFLVPSSKTVNMDVLTVIPDILVDAPSSNPGGNPNVKLQPPPAPPVQTQPQPQPQAQPPAPAPPPPKTEPVVKPEPVAPKDPTPQKPPHEPDFAKPATGKRQPTVNPKPSVRKPNPRAKASDTSADSAAEERAAERAAANARNQARLALKGAAESIGNVASSSPSVEIPSGPGGLAYANYAQYVKTVYTEAWAAPADINDDNATTKASVTIARDGTVVSWKIVDLSGNSAMDASVRNTLERVRTIGREFPTGAKEDQRTFTISFNLKAKRQLG
jgi:outer membrane biosynthesis protein TonB